MPNTYARQRQIEGSSADWLAHDLILGDGELAIERQAGGTVRAKVGNGALPFSAAPYLSGDVAGLIYRGEIDPTGPPPTAEVGDFYSARPAGVVAPAWGEPAAGETLAIGDLLAFDAGGKWNVIPGTIDPAGFVLESEIGAPTGAAMVGFQQAGTGAGVRTMLEKAREWVSLADFEGAGDGSTDNLAAWHKATAYLSTLGGGVLIIPSAPGAWRFVINEGVPDRGVVIPDNVEVLAFGALIHLECDRACYGIRVRNFSAWRGGRVAVTVSTDDPLDPATQTIWHSPFSAGDAYGMGGTVGAVSPFHYVEGWTVADVQCSSVRDGWVAFVGYGGVSGGKVTGITVGDSATCLGLVGFDWGFIGDIQSGNIPLSYANFAAGTAFTTHPYGIDVADLFAGHMTRLECHIFRLSGVHQITGRNINVKSLGANGTVYFHTAGDCGYEFAPAAIKPFRHRGIKVSAVRCYDAGNATPVYIDAYSDDVDEWPGYSELIGTTSRLDMTLADFYLRTSLAAPLGSAIRVQKLAGITITNLEADGFVHGVNVEIGGDEVKLRGGTISNTTGACVRVGHATTRPQFFSARDVRMYRAGRAGLEAGCIELVHCDHAAIKECLFGLTGAETAKYAVRADGTVTMLTVESNHCSALGASGVPYSFGAGEDFNILKRFENNTSSATGTAAPYAGQPIRPRSTDSAGRRIAHASRFIMLGDTTPPGGDWVEGSRIVLSDVNPGGMGEAVCITSGSPGFWRRCNPIEGTLADEATTIPYDLESFAPLRNLNPASANIGIVRRVLATLIDDLRHWRRPE